MASLIYDPYNTPCSRLVEHVQSLCVGTIRGRVRRVVGALWYIKRRASVGAVERLVGFELRLVRIVIAG